MAKKVKIVEETLYEAIREPVWGGMYSYSIVYIDKEGLPIRVTLPISTWDKSSIVNGLIRSRYSQDRVEAIINNHFLNIADWLDLKFKGEDIEFEDSEYDELQRWRKKSKELADEALQVEFN